MQEIGGSSTTARSYNHNPSSDDIDLDPDLPPSPTTKSLDDFIFKDDDDDDLSTVVGHSCRSDEDSTKSDNDIAVAGGTSDTP